MKPFFMFMLIAASAVALSVPLAAQQSGNEPFSCFQVVGTSDYYFGTIDADQTVEHTFVFKNNCKEVVEIDNVRPSCGCTAAVLSDKVIQPGGEAKIQVKFTPPKGTRGKTSKTVTVMLKGKTDPHTILRFSADVKTELDIQPQYIQLLGAEVGKPITGKATIKNMTGEPLEILEIPFSATSYADTSMVAGGSTTVAIPLTHSVITPTTPFTLKPNEQKEISVTLTPEYKGQLNGSLRIKTKKSEAFLQVFGIVREKSPEVNVDKK
ncbi:MAG: DUF1573 domain-containing protein [Bacteroidota bacterium]|nr:DUF1573 domain-containing protein [Bacteroidota bacterium]